MGLKTKLGLAVATSAAGAALIAGGTFALFTSTAQNTGNQFTAGTVVVDASNGGQPVFASTDATFNNMAPGDSGSRTITIKNTGTLGEWVKISSITPTTTTGTIFDNTSTDVNSSNNVTANDQPLSLTPNADLSGSNTGYYIPSGGSTTITINYSLPLAANNFYQGTSGTATISVEAVQARNNTIGGNTAIPTTAGPGVGPSSWS